MIITRLELDHFAGLADFQLDLTDGINVFYGDNGTGKTTLGLFIKTMLYGVGNDRKKDDVTLRMHIIPLSGQTASGRMIIATGGRQLEIARSFGQTKKHDRLAMTWLDDGSRLEIANEPGEYFLELNEETFSRTFFLGEMNHAILSGTTGELTSRLMNLTITGHENMDYHKALKTLKEEARALTNQRETGSLDRLMVEKDTLERGLETADQLIADRKALEEQLRSDQSKKLNLIHQIEHLKEKADSLEHLKELEDYERAMLLLAKKADLEARIERINCPIEITEVTRIKAHLGEFIDQQSRLEEQVNQHNEAARRLEDQEASFTPEYDKLFDPANEKIVRDFLSHKEALETKMDLVKDLTPLEKNQLSSWSQKLRTLDQRMDRLNGPLFWLLGAGLVLLVGLYGISVQNYPLIIGGSIGIIGLVTGFVFFRKNYQNKLLLDQQTIKQHISAMLGSGAGADVLLMQITDPNFSLEGALAQWEEQYGSLATKVQEIGLQMEDLGDFLKEQVQYETEKSLWQLHLRDVSENHRLLQREADQLDNQRSILMKELTPLELACDKTSLGSLERLLNQLEVQQQDAAELDRTLVELTTLSQDRNLNPILLEPQKHREAGVRHELDLQRQLHYELDQAKEETAGLNLRIVTAQGHLELLNSQLADKTTLSKRLAEISLEIERSRHRRRVLDLAIENLEASYREIQRDYLPRVSQAVSRTFKALTGGQFDRVLLSGDFKMKIPLAGELSSMEYLSRGNQDLLWLGLRLSLCAIIVHGEKAPLIFDDSFLHLDEERLKNVLNYLSERIDGQIIILTCHHRETRLLKEMDLL